MSLTSITDTITGVFIPQVKVYNFFIYTNDAIVAAADTTSNNDAIAIAFNNLYELDFENKVDIAWEPLENGQFSTDSIHNNPFILKLTGIVCPLAKSASYSNEDYRNELNKTIIQLNTYLQNTTILTILNNRPLFDQYSDLKLKSYKYSVTPNHSNLIAHLEFQQVRMVTSTQYGSLQQNQVANPANTSQVNNGQQTPLTPANDNSVVMAGG